MNQVDECPINDDYKQMEIESMDLVDLLEYNRQNKIRAAATEIYLEEYEATGSLEFAKYCYFRHLNIYL